MGSIAPECTRGLGTLPRVSTTPRPPSVDRLARSMAGSGLPHPLCVELAREAIAAGPESWTEEAATRRAVAFARTLLMPVVNATGVLLHTNLGRAPLALAHPARAMNIEFDLSTGERGSRQRAVGDVLARLCGAEAAMIVNNNAAAVMLVLAALARGRSVAVSRGESVEIGGSFRVPEVMEQSGAHLVDVGTTNRTRLADYESAVRRHGDDLALLLKVHPSNYRVEGFVEETSVAEMATLGVPVVADIGSGLIDANCPWWDGPPPAWLGTEPAARQSLADGAALVTFSGDKLLGGPQAGIIAGRADLVRACASHPLARALRPGSHVLLALQEAALAFLRRTACDDIPFWRMASTPVTVLDRRATAIVTAAGIGEIVASEAVPGAGSAPGSTIESLAIRLEGDHLASLRAADPPVIARTRDGATFLDMRTIDAVDDDHVAAALRACAS
ncbi:MAG: L-seryl-tRNA(Sec) selenium transferase [Actinomycetota bacterium]